MTQHIADAFGLPLLGQIPIQPNIREGGDTGAPIATGENHAFAEIAQRITEALEKRESDLPEITIV